MIIKLGHRIETSIYQTESVIPQNMWEEEAINSRAGWPCYIIDMRTGHFHPGLEDSAHSSIEDSDIQRFHIVTWDLGYGTMDEALARAKAIVKDSQPGTRKEYAKTMAYEKAEKFFS